MLDVTVTATAVPAAVNVMLSGLTLSVGSPAACDSVDCALCPPFAVTVNVCERAAVVVFAAAVSVILKLYSAVAPGSPVIAVLFAVLAPPAE